MSDVVAFTRYIGLVVLVAALVLAAPRATVAGWAGVVRWLHGRLHALVTWRPGTQVATDRLLEVDVRVGGPRASTPDEVLEAHSWPSPLQALRELWSMTHELLEAWAVALAALGLLLRTADVLVERLPQEALLGGDLLLVLGTFLVMQRVIRDYPTEGLPSWRARTPGRETARRQAALPTRVRHVLSMLVLVPGFLVLVAWPTEIGRFVAEKQFTGPESTVLVVWACELPWLIGLAWALARPLIPPRSRGRHARPSAPVVALRRRAVEAQERQAA